MRIDVPARHPFVIVMRDDSAHCVHELTGRLAARSRVPRAHLVTTVRAKYLRFQQEVRDGLRQAMARPDGVTFHVADPVALERAVRSRVGERALISLDPLVAHAHGHLRLSRGFLLGGGRSVGLVARPGAPRIADQLAALRARLAGAECALVEDDVCTGGSVEAATRLLRAAGIRVAHVVPGIRLTAPGGASTTGVPMHPVIDYRMPRSGAVDLTDSRNYLLGMSGLAVRLPRRQWGRAPYWLPFVSAASRIGISPGMERAFAKGMLEANARFFTEVERTARYRIRVGDLCPGGRRLLTSLEIAWTSTPVLAVLEQLASSPDRYVEIVQRAKEREVEGR
ncbi:hypothetical protein ACOBQB_05700 [Streptomyces sp. G5(2025)]|uniref:hypothetical protein n=1 Tax=Streptomyces sp. G5(2025) TaxID=3406628 RepID=UPI003C132C93